MTKKSILTMAILGLLAVRCIKPERFLTIGEVLDNFPTEVFLNHLTNLSSDQMAGRGIGTVGFDSAANYVISEVKSLGLVPAGTNGFKQDFKVRRSTIDLDLVQARVNDDILEIGKSYAATPISHVDSIQLSSPIVFVGLGIDAPQLGYNDFENIDVEDKVAMVILETPDHFSITEKAILGNFEVIENKLIEKGAVGVIAVFSKSLEARFPWSVFLRIVSRPRYNYLSPQGPNQLPAILLHYSKASEILDLEPAEFALLVKQLKGGNPKSFELNKQFEFKATFKHEDIACYNVGAILNGTDQELSKEYLVMTAHLDHLGIGNAIDNDSIYNGAIDNASGSAGLITIAEQLTKIEPPKRSILFLWLSAEEKGLLGSEYFVENPTVDPEKIVACQNMDVMNGLIEGGRNIIAYGYDQSNLSKSVDYASSLLDLARMEDPNPEQNFFVRSDQFSFVRKGYPSIWATSGPQPQQDSLLIQNKFLDWMENVYHKPSDDSNQPLDTLGGEKELKLNFLTAHHISSVLDSIYLKPNPSIERKR